MALQTAVMCVCMTFPENQYQGNTIMTEDADKHRLLNYAPPGQLTELSCVLLTAVPAASLGISRDAVQRLGPRAE